MQGQEAFQLAQNVMFFMAFLAAGFVVLVVREAAAKAKHLQEVSGARLPLFWLATFAADYLLYLAPCLLVLATYAAFRLEHVAGGAQLRRLFVLFAAHGLAALPAVYAAAFLFAVASSAYAAVALFNIVLGIGAFIAVAVTELPLLDLLATSRALDWLFTVLLPNYGLGRAFYNLYQNDVGNQYCNTAVMRAFCAVANASDPAVLKLLICCPGNYILQLKIKSNCL